MTKNPLITTIQLIAVGNGTSLNILVQNNWFTLLLWKKLKTDMCVQRVIVVTFLVKYKGINVKYKINVYLISFL